MINKSNLLGKFTHYKEADKSHTLPATDYKTIDSLIIGFSPIAKAFEQVNLGV